MADWLFEVGVDTTKADATLKDFVLRATQTLDRIPKVTINVSITRNAVRNITALSDALKVLGAVQGKNVDVNVNADKALAQLREVRNELRGLSRGYNLSTIGSGFSGIESSARGAAAGIGGGSQRTRGAASVAG